MYVARMGIYLARTGRIFKQRATKRIHDSNPPTVEDTFIA
jgi:hypothetical protein